MDPAETFPVEIMEMIFGNLSGRTLKRCLLVNSNWNNQIAESKICMKKMLLTIEDDWKHKTSNEKDELVMNRNHQNVKISGVTELSDCLPRLLGFGHEWKSVYMVDTKFATTSQFKEAIAKFSKTIENLEMFRITVKHHDKNEAFLKFPNLKCLKISMCEDEAIDIFDHCPKLETLMMLNPKETSKTPLIVYEMLNKLKSLKKLHFDRKWLDIIFINDNSDKFSFQLENFSVVNYQVLNLELDNSNFVAFLKSQSSYIKTLHLGDVLGTKEEFLRIAYGMPLLKKLSAYHFPAETDLNVPINKSIENLDLVYVNIKNQNQLLALLKASPNIKILITRRLDDKCGTVITNQLHKLHFITVLSIVDEKTLKTLPSFKIENHINICKLTRSVKQ